MVGELLQRWSIIPHGQRNFIIAVVMMWSFSSVGFIFCDVPLSDIGENKPYILNNEASLRHFLREHDEQWVRFIGMLYTSPLETWWHATNRWSRDLVMMLAKNEEQGERALKAFKEWYSVTPQERLDNMEVQKIPVENLNDFLVEMKLHDDQVHDDVTTLPETVMQLKAQEKFCNATSCITQDIAYTWEEVEKWATTDKAQALGWDNFDPYNREKERRVYRKILALSRLYQSTDPQVWERRYEAEPIDMHTVQSVAYGAIGDVKPRARDDWHITDAAMNKMSKDSKLRRWFENQPNRSLEAVTVMKALNALNVYIQSHDTNTVGWMYSRAIADLRGRMIHAYATDPRLGEVGDNCLNIGRGVCLT